MLHDLKYALRTLRNSPAFAAVAILSLALGIGANTAIFTIVNAMLLKSLPVQEPARLMQVRMGKDASFSTAAWEEIRNRQDVFSSLTAFRRARYNLADGGEFAPVNSGMASGEFYSTLGVRAALGRVFTKADDQPGCPAVAVISHDFWSRHFASDPNVVGKSLHLDTHPFQIIGVTEAGFFGIEVGNSYDVTVPLCAQTIVDPQSNALTSRRTWWLQLIGRLKPGVDQRHAATRLKTLAPLVFEASLPLNATGAAREAHLRRPLDVAPGGRGISSLRAEYSAGLGVIMAIVGVVLLIACTNLANLLLARATVRQREIAVRLAIGASRGRLIRQLLTESLLLSFLGALAGSLFAAWTSPLLVAFISRSDARVYLDTSLDARSLAFTAGVALLSGLLFGLAPALRGSSLQPNLALKEGGRRAGAGSRFGLGEALVVSQVALSLVLLIGSALLVKTFRNLLLLDTGFRHDNVLLATVEFGNQRLPPDRRATLRDEIMDRVRALPGVRHAAQSNAVPIGGGYITNGVVVEGDIPRSADDGQAYFNDVSPDYFSALSTPLLAGREFDVRDRRGAPRVAVVNEGFARKFFARQNPVGRSFYVGEKAEGEPVAIVGLVKDAKYATLRDEAPPTVYLSLLQVSRPFDSMNVELAANGNPAGLVPLVRKAIGEVNRGAILQFTTFDTQIGDSLIQERLLATLSGFFGVLAVLLSAIGLYGVMSFMVARRRAEIGIRMALGAQPSGITALVLREVVALALAGLLIGLPLTLASTRVLGGMLFGITPTDPVTIGLAMALLAAVAILAGYLPARKAARIDPMTAIREA